MTRWSLITGVVLGVGWRLDEERDALGAVVGRPVLSIDAMFAKLFAVVRRDDDESLVVQVPIPEFVEQFADPLVYVSNLRIVVGDQFVEGVQAFDGIGVHVHEALVRDAGRRRRAPRVPLEMGLDLFFGRIRGAG